MLKTKKHITLILAIIMAFTVMQGLTLAVPVSAAELAKPKLTNYAASSTSIKNTWKKVKGAKGYEIYRATEAKGKYKKVKTIKSGKTVSWTNKKLKKNKNYYFKVRAYKTEYGTKVYGRYSSVQWAVPTNSPNWGYSMGKKSKTAKTIKLKLTNKSRYTMTFKKEGLFFKNIDSLGSYLQLSAAEQKDPEVLKAIGAFEVSSKTVKVKPGKTVTLSYKAKKSVKYSKKAILEGVFKYNKKNYRIRSGWDFGSGCDRI